MHRGYTVTEHDGSAFSDEEVVLGAELDNRLWEERMPDDVPTPPKVALAAHRAVPSRVLNKTFRAWAPDGSLVGHVALWIDPEHDDNPALLTVQVKVHPDHRRRGVGTALLARAVEHAADVGRARLIGHTTAGVPGDEFAAAIGATAQAAGHANHLVLEDVDRDLLETWVQEGPTRAPGYEVLSWDGPVPDEYLDAFVDLVLVMNDAPRDGLDMNDFTLSASEWREAEAQMTAAGFERWILVARRIDDGALAGFHEVAWSPAEPGVAYVGSTGVRPDHRGHALGKWLKATMTLRLMDQRPTVREIRTDNADSNDAMLGINRLIGYKPMYAQTVWELPVTKAKAWLEERRPGL